ncbi:hypothetical protein F5Y00DRAFT_273585 [Daldinia vernicosa]|uniref:uncharacterized protein n=1 Tax=Daldinia vernicosa TaxID=114800 RepID=UPI002008C786|nr:uncharacterized protein F5Y00DRAFT_273585 [Daldinia vernicosa]KAI0844758.1 hypothetical protein F5Y00DRAFT_273585 [Daldinia vernicosa]
MASLKPGIFQEFQERHLLSHRDFKPVSVKVIELENFEAERPTIHSFILNPEDFEGWLDQIITTNNHSCQKPKFRIILGYVGKGAKYEYLMPGNEFRTGDITSESMTALPFSKEHCQLIRKKLGLPDITSLLPSRGASPLVGHFQLVQLASEEGNPIYGLTLNAFTSLLVGIKIGVSMSYCPSTGVTNAVMMRSGPRDGFNWLEQDLDQLASLADNPFLVPTLVSQHLTEAFCSAIDRNFDRLHEAEFRSGQTGITMIGENGMPMSRGNCEDPNLSVTVLGVAQHVLAVEAYIRGQLLTVDLIKNEMLAFPWQQFPSINQDRIKEQNGLLVKQLDFISRTLDIALIRIDHLKQRTTVQATAIANLLAQRNNEMNCRLAESSTSIAHDTRRDSLAMKSIAVLTMVFLPATFVATYFTTPAVAALEPSQSLYWVVTVPLTLIVVILWIFSFYILARDKFPSFNKGSLV